MRFTAATPLEKRSDEEENTGTPASRASRKISTASRSDAATGLSINTGLRAASTRRAWSR